MLKIHQIRVEIGDELSVEHIARKLKTMPSDILSYEIERESLDARGNDLHFSYTVYARVRNEEKYLRLKDVTAETREDYVLPVVHKKAMRPVVIGFGPAGMYAALLLAECGLKPLVIERGSAVEKRSQDVERFFHDGTLDEESNVQFGEGGAGTFSDGKLTTRIKNFRIRKVLEEFVEAGADPKIIYEHRAHLGTDVLCTIVKNIREKIIRLGGEVHFDERLEKLVIKDGAVSGIETNLGQYEAEHIILAIGHSAADTYHKLLLQGVQMEQKDFAAGVRVEHPQSLIDQCTYGRYAGHPALGAASYQLHAKTSVNRGVYSFCMCPGGVVIPSSIKEGELVVNGMSYSSRDGANANSAILVQIFKKDFDHGHPLDGFTFQKELERKAYRNGFVAPAQNIADYLSHQKHDLCLSSSYPLGITTEDMHNLFPSEVNVAMEEGFRTFDKRIHGFVDQGIMVGMESRSSSPVRLVRNEAGESLTIRGLFPCGEGAGYAGGIVSSATDGLKQAENVISMINRNGI